MSNENKSWWSVAVTVETNAVEAIEFGLNEAGALGTEIDLLGKRQPQLETIVTGYFDEMPDDEFLGEQIANALAIHGHDETAFKQIEINAVENKDWLAEWKKHWRPTETGRFIIAPPWSAVDNTDKIVIRVEPNMAFGTGTHETTQLCLKAISERYKAPMSVLDVGTGTGILAIAAAKLGGSKILACDTDVDSVKIARENTVLNDVGGQIEFFDGPIDTATPEFGFVCANLTIDAIVPILDLLLSKAKHTLLLSGILAEQEQQIRDALITSQISDPQFEIERKGEWISVIVKVSQAS